MVFTLKSWTFMGPPASTSDSARVISMGGI
jgi:hypothetical protein